MFPSRPKAPVVEFPKDRYTTLSVSGSIPQGLIDSQLEWFFRRTLRELNLPDTNVAPAAIDLLVHEITQDSPKEILDRGLRRFMISAPRPATGQNISIALVPRGTDTAFDRLQSVTLMDRVPFVIEDYMGNVSQHAFIWTGLDLLTGDYIYREEEEA